MTTSQLVSDYRTNYKLHSDDSKFTDRFIVSIANVVRAKLLYQKAKREKTKRTNFVGFCLPLCLGKPLACPCIAEAQCYALVAKYPIPNYISVDDYTGLEIRTGDGELLDLASPRNVKLWSLNPALRNKKAYWIENYRGVNNLVIWNTLDLEIIYVSMMPENIDDIAAIAFCSDAAVDSCSDWTTEQFPLDSELIFDLYKMMNELINSRLRSADDKVNDFNDKLIE